MKRISFQGERGAYSEAASISCFEDEIETIPCSTFADALKNTENNQSDYSSEITRLHHPAFHIALKRKCLCYPTSAH